MQQLAQQWYFDDTGHGFHRPVVKQANLALEIENVNGVIGTGVVGEYRRDGDHQAGNLTQAARWPPQQWRLTMTAAPPTSLALNGSTASAEVPASTALNLTADWTIETWFKDESPLGFNHEYLWLVYKGDREGSGEASYFLTLGYKTLVAGVRAAFVDQTVRFDLRGAGVDPARWHHAAAAFDGGTRTLTLYLDGAPVAAGALNRGSAGNALPLQIGRTRPSNGKYFGGKLDDVRVWNVARSASEIASSHANQLSTPQAGLVANWTFDTGAGTTVPDVAGAHDAALRGGATYTSDVHP